MLFSIFAGGGSCQLSPRPGIMRWDAKAQVLTAFRASDMIPVPVVRHTYRYADGAGFVLMKFERGKLFYDGGEEWGKDWQVEWEAALLPR
jgi:hypothetical protein